MICLTQPRSQSFTCIRLSCSPKHHSRTCLSEHLLCDPIESCIKVWPVGVIDDMGSLRKQVCERSVVIDRLQQCKSMLTSQMKHAKT